MYHLRQNCEHSDRREIGDLGRKEDFLVVGLGFVLGLERVVAWNFGGGNHWQM